MAKYLCIFKTVQLIILCKMVKPRLNDPLKERHVNEGISQHNFLTADILPYNHAISIPCIQPRRNSLIKHWQCLHLAFTLDWVVLECGSL